MQVKKYLLFSFLCVAVLTKALAQLTGNTSTPAGVSNTYVLNVGTVFPTYTWTTGGTNTNDVRTGTSYSVDVVWPSAGTYTVKFTVNGAIIATKTVTVTTNCVPPAPVATLTVSNNPCGTRAITYTGTPPAGVTWYWQTSPSGTSTTFQQFLPITTSGTYYLNARATCGNTNYWSSSISIAATVNPIPAVPVTPTITTNLCYPKTLIKAGTIPSGISWYWQGINSSGNDYTSATATAATYSAAINGTNTYYISARDNTTGCWSSPTNVAVTVDNPPAPTTPSPFSYCEMDAMPLSVTGTSNSCNWYISNNNILINNGLTYTPTKLVVGSYSYDVKNVSGNNCESTSAATVILNVTPCDNYFNTTETTAYGPLDAGTNSQPSIGASKSYSDAFGKVLQSQSKSFTTNNVFAVQNIYDSRGAQTLTTLPAPISSSTFGYRSWFTEGPSVQPYSAADFDGTTTLNAPNVVNHRGPGSVGWYYSSDNTLEPNTPVTKYPYSRSWTEDGPNPLKSRSAGPGDAYRMGNQHESISERQNILAGELDHYFQLRPQFVTTPNLYSPNLLSGVSTTSLSGFTAVNSTLALTGTNVKMISSTITSTTSSGIYPIGGSISVTAGKKYTFYVRGYKSVTNAVNLYVTSSTGSVIVQTGAALPVIGDMVSTSFIVPAGITAIKVGVMWSQLNMSDIFYISDVQLRAELPIAIGYKYISTDADGKKTVTFVDYEGNTLATALITSTSTTTPVTYTYDNWSYSYYDNIGLLVASILPNGVAIGDPSPPNFVKRYTYDYLGRMIEVTSPDEGTSRFIYSIDGKLRFSQSNEQRISSPSRFSYTNYDYKHRVIESGEYTSNGTSAYVFEPSTVATLSTNSVLNLTEDVGYINLSRKNAAQAANCSDYSFVEYDVQSDFVGDANHLAQTNLFGKVARTENTNAITWYSYDESGHINWTIQSIPLSQSLQWTNMVNVTSTGSNITKTGGANGTWGDAGAFSVQSIPANTDGWVEFTSGQVGTAKMMGLSATDVNASYNAIAYAFYTELNGNLTIYENGAAKVSGVSTYSISDILRVERMGSTVVYKKNGVVLYTSLTPSTSILYADCTFWNSNSSFNNVFLNVVKGSTITKTIDYTYDYFGNVTQTAYSASAAADKFYHHYTYDIDQRLTQVATSTDGTNKTVRANYYYYLHGPVKKIELMNGATKVQGIDYVYTIDGALKSINHADPAKDPGGEGTNDIFGMTLQYNDTDYQGAGYSAGLQTVSGTTNQFGGNVKSISWHSPADNNKQKNTYAFTYDNVNQLSNALFGSMTGTSGSYGFTPATGEANREGVTLYDKNGNIKSLVRKGKTGNSLANYSYDYETNTNRLDKVNDNGSILVDYTYNTIGQMITQVETGKTMKVSYNAYGLVKEVKDGSDKLIESYFYDDRGGLVHKILYNAGVITRHTYYVHDVSGNIMSVNDQDVTVSGALKQIEVPVYGLDRIALFKPQSGPVGGTYFYEVKDHLGNVRGVIGLPGIDNLTATMESEVTEEPPFKGIAARRVPFNPLGNQAGNEAVRLNNANPAGPGIALKVSPGDVIDQVSVKAYYQGDNANQPLSNSIIAAAIASVFTQGVTSSTDIGKITSGISTGFTDFAWGGGPLADPDNPPALPPHAYLMYQVFDDNMVYQYGGYSPVDESANMAWGTVSLSSINIDHPGFVYLYVFDSDDSPIWVYFDNLTYRQTHTPIVAGADYYPFGLTLENREIKTESYRFGYQGQFSEKDLTTGWNEFELRNYDARFGRWISPDPYGQYASPYIGMGNIPNMGTDPDGGFCCGGFEDLALAYAISFGVEKAVQTEGTLLDEIIVVASALQRRFNNNLAGVADYLSREIPYVLQRNAIIANGVNQQINPFMLDYGGNSWDARNLRQQGAIAFHAGTMMGSNGMLAPPNGSFEIATPGGPQVSVPITTPRAIPTVKVTDENGQIEASWEKAKRDYWKLKNNGKTPTGKARVRAKDGEIKEIEVYKELHHKNGRKIPDAHNHSNLEEVWPWEHELIDKHRHTGYIFLEWV